MEPLALTDCGMAFASVHKMAKKQKVLCACGCGQLTSRVWAIGHNPGSKATKGPLGQTRFASEEERKAARQVDRDAWLAKHPLFQRFSTLNGKAEKLGQPRLSLKGKEISFPEFEVWFADTLTEQCGRCDICGDTLTRPVTDHNHTTGELRSLLCTMDNSLDGRSTLKLQSILDYKYKHQEALSERYMVGLT